MLARLAVAASLVVRHAGAYADLVLCDVEEARREAGRQLWVGTLMATALIFAIAMACLLVIAVTWDTSARLWIVGGLLCVFSAAALIGYIQLRAMSTRHGLLFAHTVCEWEKDRALLEKLLSGMAMTPPTDDER